MSIEQWYSNTIDDWIEKKSANYLRVKKSIRKQECEGLLKTVDKA